MYNIESDLHVNLREEFDYLVDKFGFNVLYVRNNKLTRCHCYDPLHKSGNRKCKICGGTGKVSTIGKVKVIHQNVNSSSYVKMTELELGVNNTVILYFDYLNIPKQGDQVFIVGYDDRGIPVDIKNSCYIMSVEEVRGDRGRVEFYKTYAKYSPEKIRLDQNRLNAIPLEYKKELVKGKRFTWFNQ